MKQKIKKTVLRVLSAREAARQKALEVVIDCSGNILTDHAGLTIAGILVVLVGIAFAIPWTRDTFLPKAGKSIMDMFSTSLS